MTRSTFKVGDNADMLRTVQGDVEPFPGAESEDVQQIFNDTCAVKSQQIILESFGIDIPEETLANEAAAKGYYMPGGGTSPENVGKLLVDHGIPAHGGDGGNVYDLVNELAQGHKVIVGVDADELWKPSIFNDLFGEEANHALIVTGIDTTDPDDVKVILTDPGTGEVAATYPIDQFVDAWEDSNCFYVATDVAPSAETDPTMVNFDYDAGHLPDVAGIPYDDFTDTVLPEMTNFIDGLPDDALSADVYSHMNDIFNQWQDDSSLNLHDQLFDGLDGLFS